MPETVHKVIYLINNPSCTAPFSIEVFSEAAGGLDYVLEVKIFNKCFTRNIVRKLDAIIIAKDIARALEDAFRHTYEDKSKYNG